MENPIQDFWVLQFCIATTTCSIFHLLTHSYAFITLESFRHLSGSFARSNAITQVQHIFQRRQVSAAEQFATANLYAEDAIHAITVLSWKDLHR